MLKQFEYLEQNRSSVDYSSKSGATRLHEEENGAQLLSKSYLVDLYENFDSESTHLDPLSPFDVDTMLNKLSATLTSSSSSAQGALSSSGSNSSGTNNLNLSNVVSPIYSNLNLRQQEHQQNHILIPKLFDFLLLLSHEKKTTTTQASTINTSGSSNLQKQLPPQVRPNKNNLLTVPEIMQLCDNLIASENSPHTHAIPALRPLVVDLFLNRPSDEANKELDMQRDVIMMTMLRLVQYPQMWPLLTLAVTKYKSMSSSSEDKWKKCSRQICDALFDSMRASNAKLKFGEFTGSELRSVRRYSHSYVPFVLSLKQLLVLMNALAPQVYRPVDFILLSLFETSKVFFKVKI